MFNRFTLSQPLLAYSCSDGFYNTGSRSSSLAARGAGGRRDAFARGARAADLLLRFSLLKQGRTHRNSFQRLPKRTNAVAKNAATVDKLL